MRKIIQNKFIQMWLIIGIIAGFAAVIFFSITYLNERILCDMDCRAKNEVSLILVLLSLFGMFIGSLTYYFISEKYQKKIDRIHKDVNLTLRFLEGEERAIVNSIIDRKGKINQSDLVKDTGLSRVKISRSLMRLEQKDIIKKSKNGMTNIVEMNKNLKRIFF